MKPEFLKYVYMQIKYRLKVSFIDSCDKVGQLIPSRMAHSRRKGELVKRILEQYEQISQEDISNHIVSCVANLVIDLHVCACMHICM